MNLKFSAEVIYWRGPAPFYFVPVPEAQSAKIKAEAARLTYGWGVIPVMAKIGKTEFSTTLFPKDGAYLVPIKNAVRFAEDIDIDDLVHVILKLG